MATAVVIARYGDEEGEIAALVRRGGKYYLRTEHAAYTPRAGQHEEELISSRVAGLVALRTMLTDDEMNAIIVAGPRMGEARQAFWSEFPEEEEEG